MTQLDRASAFEAEGCRVEPGRGRPTRSEQPGFVEPTGVEREVCARRMCVTHELRTEGLMNSVPLAIIRSGL
jgi:hypothetical protein